MRTFSPDLILKEASKFSLSDTWVMDSFLSTLLSKGNLCRSCPY